MFKIGSVFSSFTTVQPGIFSDILRRAIPSISQAIDTRGLLEGLSKAGGGASAQGAAQQIAQALAGGAAGKPGMGAGGRLDGLPDALTKTMYISVLLEAVENARGKQHFNVETAINDLWVKLAKVRPKQNQQLDQTFQQVTNILKQMHDMKMSAVRNIR